MSAIRNWFCLYPDAKKKPGKGRYPMGPTNIDRVDIGSCVWYPTFLVDTVSGRRLRVSTRMKMANQVKRSKIANCLKKNYGGYAGRLRRLCREKEKARDRSVPDGSDKHRQSRHWQMRLVSNIFGGHI